MRARLLGAEQIDAQGRAFAPGPNKVLRYPFARQTCKHCNAWTTHRRVVEHCAPAVVCRAARAPRQAEAVTCRQAPNAQRYRQGIMVINGQCIMVKALGTDEARWHASAMQSPFIRARARERTNTRTARGTPPPKNVDSAARTHRARTPHLMGSWGHCLRS